MLKNVKWFFIFFCFFPIVVEAAFEKQGALGLGARPLGMGNAFGAIAEELSGFYYNPACLAQIIRPEVTAMGGARFNGKYYEAFTGVGLPALADVFFGITYQTISNTLSGSSEDTYGFSIANKMNNERTFSLGMNLKYYYTNLFVEGGVGRAFGIDLGALYEIHMSPFINKLNLGVSIQDMDTKLLWSSGTDNPITRVIKVGAAYWFDPNIVFDIDYDYAEDRNIASTQNHYTHAGVEAWFFEKHLGLRGGYTAFLTLRGKFAMGITGRTNNWEVDYAYLSHDHNLGDSHRLSIILRFGAVTTAQIPKTVKGVQAKAGDGLIYASWQANTEANIGGYHVYVSKDPRTGYYKEATVKETYHTIKGLTLGSKYYVVVTAFTNDAQPAESNYSLEAQGIPSKDAATPGARLAVVQPGGKGAVAFKIPEFFSQSSVGYNVYFSETQNSGYMKFNTEPLSPGPVTVPGLETGKTYYIITRAVNAAGQEGPPSKAVPFVATPFGKGK